MKRVFDLFLSLCLVPILLVPILVIAVLVRLTSRGPALYWSDRVGVGNKIFKMPKFRTMRIDSPAVATHLLSNPDEYLTPIGPFLRKSSLDELPQLWSVLKGDMSFVGPRPALFNQDDLIALRTERCSSINSGDHGMGAD
jgi:O-antigen biosynthesis protein WbqP